MTKHDRAKMEARLERSLPWIKGSVMHRNTIRFVQLEVDRAVRAERRAQRIATDEANKWREEAREKALREVVQRMNRR